MSFFAVYARVTPKCHLIPQENRVGDVSLMLAFTKGQGVSQRPIYNDLRDGSIDSIFRSEGPYWWGMNAQEAPCTSFILATQTAQR